MTALYLLVQDEDLLLAQEEDLLPLAQEEALLLAKEENLFLAQEEALLPAPEEDKEVTRKVEDGQKPFFPRIVRGPLGCHLLSLVPKSRFRCSGKS